ncbi:50S ribosomal protein L9, partial [Candidatus Magnetomorum sp. HK-1]
MEIILIENDKILGEKGEIINVAPGYARNFLFPNNLAVLADQSNIKHFESIKRAQTKKIEKLKIEEETLKTSIEKLNLEIEVKSGINKKIFGSVTTELIAETINKELNIDISRKRISITTPIKYLGNYSVLIKLKYQITATLKIKVIADKESIQAIAAAEEKKKKEEKKDIETETKTDIESDNITT